MPTILQLRRGSTAENDAYTGSVGEITVDTTLSTVRLHDGSTAGGSLVGNLQKNIQLGITGDNEIDTSSGNLTIDSAGGTVTIDDNLNISGTTTVSGHILPDADVTYDLGSSSFKFRDIYLSGTSINLGDATITASGSSIVLPSGSAISGGSGDVVDLNSSQILTNKTLTSPVISTISNSGTVTIPTGTVTLASTSYVDTAVANVIDSAPGALDTLNELAAALGDDANYASTTTAALSNRLRIDTNAQGLTSTQKSNAITNLGLSTVATSGSYTDLSNTSSVVTLSGTQTLTNKTISASSNTITDIPNSSLTNSSITINGSLLPLGGTLNVGDITEVIAGTLLDGGGTSGEVTLNVDLSELSTSTTNGDGDYFVVVDTANAQRKLTKANIAISGFNNDAGYITASSSDTLTNKSGNISQWTNNSGYLTSTNINTSTSGSNALITLTNSAGGSDSVTLAAGSNITISESGDTITIASTAGSSYTDSDVNTHLNTSTASSGEVLSWNGSDYDWVAQSGGSSLTGITDNATGSVLTLNDTHIETERLDVQYIDNNYGQASGGQLSILTFDAFDVNIKYNQYASSNAFRIDGITGTDIRHTGSSKRIQTQSYGTEFLNGVIKIPVLTTAPTSPADGMIAIADGSGWDPVTSGAQSMVAYLDSAWTSLTGGGGSSLTIQDEGSTLTTDATTLNFVGAGVTASGTGSTKTINISGGASTIGALNDVTITSPAINQVLKYNGSAWVNAADATGSGSADLGAVAEDILPSFDEIYDIGSSTFKWYDGYFTNSINLDTIALTNSSGTLSINSDVIVGSLLVDSLLLSENTITADASTAIQYLGDKGVVEINSSNLDVREGDWIGVPVVETVDSVPPLTTGAEGIIRYNKDESRFEGYNSEGWASLGGLEKNDDGDNIITGNLIVSGDITSTSDETLKDNIKSIEGALDIVTKLSGKMFTMKSDETQKEKVGFIAQEIEQHLPQVVSTDPNGIKSVSYGNVAALLVEAIKELNQKIEDLKK